MHNASNDHPSSSQTYHKVDNVLYCIRILEFDAGHRIIGHENKCKMLHGHRYKGEFSFKATKLDFAGRIIDFGIIKSVLGVWLDENFDHNVILCEQDAELGKFIQEFTGQKIYYLDNNPTAENIALYLLHNICPQLFKDYEVECHSIKLWETPNCYVIVNK